MRILFCGVAAIALSGCSWMGFGNSSNSGYSYGNNSAKSNSSCCVGGQTLSRWNIESSADVGFGVGGTAITGASVAPIVAAPSLNLVDVDMNDAYETMARVALGGSYALNPNRKITAQAFYGNADGNEVVWGQQGGVDLRGTMTDYTTYGVEAGLRQYFKPRAMPLVNSVRPYVEGRIGAAHVDGISLVNIRHVPNTSPNTPTSLAMYDGGWVPTASGLVGVETPLFNRMTLAVETGIRYSGELKSDNSDVSAGFNTRYAGFNNGGEQYSIPLTIRGRYRF